MFNLAHRLVHKVLPRTVALDYGDLRIVAHSMTERFIRAHSAKKEPETVEWIESLPAGSVLWDVGANIGAYSLIAARCGLTVVAFEPVRITFESLEQNAALNGLDIHCHRMGLGNAGGNKDLSLSSLEAGAAQHEMGGGLCWVELVKIQRGDHLIESGIPAPDFMKIDTDGGELEVLEGMGVYLKGVSGLLIELSPSDSDPEGFVLEGHYPIPGHDLENRRYVRELR